MNGYTEIKKVKSLYENVITYVYGEEVFIINEDVFSNSYKYDQYGNIERDLNSEEIDLLSAIKKEIVDEKNVTRQKRWLKAAAKIISKTISKSNEGVKGSNHTKNARQSTKGKHQAGDSRRQRDQARKEARDLSGGGKSGGKGARGK